MDCDDATVLLIDDEAEVREGISRLLRAVGWKAEAFASAEEFIARLPFSGVGCLLLDVSMPGMTGPELHDRIRETDDAFPIIYLTGRCDIATSVQAMKWGALDVLEKPVDEDILLKAIAAAVEQHRQDCQRRDAKNSIASRLGTLPPGARGARSGYPWAPEQADCRCPLHLPEDREGSQGKGHGENAGAFGRPTRPYMWTAVGGALPGSRQRPSRLYEIKVSYQWPPLRSSVGRNCADDS